MSEEHKEKCGFCDVHNKLNEKVELAKKIKSYCKEHPLSHECEMAHEMAKKTKKYIVKSMCKEDLLHLISLAASYGKEHPEDPRFVELKASFMKKMKKMEAFKDYCGKNPDEKMCKVMKAKKAKFEALKEYFEKELN